MYRTQKAVATQPPIMIRPPIGVMGPSIFLGPMPSVRQYILPENIRVPTAIIFPAVEKSFDAATGFPLMDWSEDDACSADRARRAVAWNSWSVGWADMRERGGKQNKILAGRCSSSTHGPHPGKNPASHIRLWIRRTVERRCRRSQSHLHDTAVRQLASAPFLIASVSLRACAPKAPAVTPIVPRADARRRRRTAPSLSLMM